MTTTTGSRLGEDLEQPADRPERARRRGTAVATRPVAEREAIGHVLVADQAEDLGAGALGGSSSSMPATCTHDLDERPERDAATVRQAPPADRVRRIRDRREELAHKA